MARRQRPTASTSRCATRSCYGVLEPGSRIDYVQLSAVPGRVHHPAARGPAPARGGSPGHPHRAPGRDRRAAHPRGGVRAGRGATRARSAGGAAGGRADDARTSWPAARELVDSQDEQEALRYLRDAGLPVAVGGLLQRQPGLSPDGLLRVAQSGPDPVPGRHIDQDRAVRDPGAPDQHGRRPRPSG